MFYSAQDPSLGNGATHTHSESGFASVKPLWKHPHRHVEVCLVGDSKSSRIDKVDEPLKALLGVAEKEQCLC